VLEKVPKVQILFHPFLRKGYMAKTYEEWKSNMEFYSTTEGISPERMILSSFYSTIEQYLRSPNSLASKGVLTTACSCVKRYLEETEK
jgi:hypothetical protein